MMRTLTQEHQRGVRVPGGRAAAAGHNSQQKGEEDGANELACRGGGGGAASVLGAARAPSSPLGCAAPSAAATAAHWPPHALASLPSLKGRAIKIWGRMNSQQARACGTGDAAAGI